MSTIWTIFGGKAMTGVQWQKWNSQKEMVVSNYLSNFCILLANYLQHYLKQNHITLH